MISVSAGSIKHSHQDCTKNAHTQPIFFIHVLLNMEYNIPRITSDSQEAKEKAEEVIEQVKAIRRELCTGTQGNIGTKSSVNEIKPLSNFENIRFRRDCDIVNHKNQIVILSRFRYSVKSQSNSGEYEVTISTELGWTCSCADHRFRNTVCKHIFAIFSMNREREADAQDRTELIVTFCDRSIAGDDDNEILEETWTLNKPKEPTNVNQVLLAEKVNQNCRAAATRLTMNKSYMKKTDISKG